MLPYISIFNKEVPMYGVCMVLGILISSYIAYKRTIKLGGDENNLIIIGSCAIGIGLAGAKILYVVVTYGIINTFEQIISGNFSLFWESGLVFYGGLIAGIAGAYLGAWLTHEDMALFCDAIVPCIALGHAFGRLGCFFAGCCYGIPCEGVFCPSFPLVGIDHSTFPVQLLEMLINLGIFVCLSCFVRKVHRRYQVLYFYLMIYAISRFILEFLRGDIVRGMSNGLSTSQWISIGLFITSICFSICQTAHREERT